MRKERLRLGNDLHLRHDILTRGVSFLAIIMMTPAFFCMKYLTLALGLIGVLFGSAWAQPPPGPSPILNPASAAGAPALTLSLNDSLSLFLEKNLDLLMTKYGIDNARGLAITAQLFPNPAFSIFGAAVESGGLSIALPTLPNDGH